MKGKRCIIALPAKKRGLVCVLLAALVLLIVLAVLLWPRSGAQVTAYTQEARKALGRDMDNYALTAVLHEEDGTLAVTQEITLTNRTGDALPDVVLRTFANAFWTQETSPAAIDELYDQTYAGGFSAGGLTLQGVWWQDALVEHAYDDEAQTVLRVETGSIAPGESGKLRIMYVLSVPECAYRFGRTDGIWQLGNAFPTLAVWESGAWRTEEYYPIGDPFVSESANWQVTLSLPDDYIPAASARMEQGEDGLWQGEILCARDFALVLSDQFTVQAKQFGDVLVQVMTTGESGKSLSLSGQILEVLCALYGDYPYDTLTVAQVDFPFGGMEYPGMVLIEDSYFAAQDDSLELLLAHEIAHQWFYALRGSDSFYQPWQDEALSQWAVLRYVRKAYGADTEERLKYYYVDAPMAETVASSVTPGSPVSYFGDFATYDSVVYGRGAALLYALDTFAGGQADAFLRTYCQADPFGLSTRQDFEDALAAFTGEDLGPLLTDYLDTLMQ